MNYHRSFAPETLPPIKILLAGPSDGGRDDLLQTMDRLGATVELVDREDALLRNLAGDDGPDALVLSRALAGGLGLDLLRRIRSRSDVPLIIVSPGETEEIDRVLAFELGADDHVEGRLRGRELIARVRAILRRGTRAARKGKGRLRRYQFADREFDPQRRRLTDAAGREETLTKTEAALLTAFVGAPRRILSRENLLNATRVHEDIYDRSIDVQVLRLRRKIENDPRNPGFIRTERGIGYLFDADVRVL
jgi:DNA-binding response OmpR family regulator